MNQVQDIFAASSMSRDQTLFMKELLHELTGVLEETIGLEDAEGFISIVGSRLGEVMNEEYREIAGQETLDLEQIALVLVDLKRRINGGFSVESIDSDKIVMVNTACPFGKHVVGRRSLCMMTSNVFGRIAADNLGFASVDLQKTIASGDDGCRVVIHFRQGEAGRAYFG